MKNIDIKNTIPNYKPVINNNNIKNDNYDNNY